MKEFLFKAALALLAGAFSAAAARAQEQQPVRWYEVKEGKVEIYLYEFWSRTCPHCTKAAAFLADLQKKYDWLRIVTYETSENPANLDLYRSMAETLGLRAGSVPAFFYCKQMDLGFVSDETTGARLEKNLLW